MASKKDFSIKKAFSYGFSEFIENWLYYVKAALLTLLFFIFMSIASSILISLIGYIIYGPIFFTKVMVSENVPLGVLTLFLIISILAAQFYLLKALTVIKALEPENDSVIDNIKDKRVWKFILARILYAIQAIFGLFLLVIPGIFWAVVYYFRGYPILDSHKNLSIIDDKIIARDLSSNVRLKLFGFSYLINLLLALSTMPIIGLFISIIATLISVSAYKQLASETDIA